MPSTKQSEDSTQMRLLDGPDLAVLAEQEQQGHFTGARLKSLRPQAYKEIVRGFAGGASMRSLARIYKVSTNTVSAIVRLEPALIEALKKEIGARSTAVHSLAWERLEEGLADDELVKKTSLKDRAVIVGITGDRMQLAAGEPTAITEHRHVGADDINAQFLDAIEVQAEEQARKTGFGVGLGGQKGLLSSDAAVRDVQSLVESSGGEHSSGLEDNDA